MCYSCELAVIYKFWYEVLYELVVLRLYELDSTGVCVWIYGCELVSICVLVYVYDSIAICNGLLVCVWYCSMCVCNGTYVCVYAMVVQYALVH